MESPNQPIESSRGNAAFFHPDIHAEHGSYNPHYAPFLQECDIHSNFNRDSQHKNPNEPPKPAEVQHTFGSLPPPVDFSGPGPYSGHAQRIEDEQEDLRDARDDLVGHRFRLQSKRRELRILRETSSTRSGTAYSLIQQHLFKSGIELPSDIKEVLDEADELRNRFGMMENEYEKAEEDYNLEEWKYTQKETAFVENLPGNEPLSYQPFQRVFSEAGPAELTQFAIGSSDVPIVQRPVAASQSSDLGLLTTEIETDLCGVSELSILNIPPLRESSPIKGSRKTEPPLRTISHTVKSRPHSEADIDRARSNWSVTRKRIEEWLLGTLLGSTLQTTRLKEMLPQSPEDSETLRDLIIQHWDSDSPEISVFHTGETTISQSGGTRTNNVLDTVTETPPPADIPFEYPRRSQGFDFAPITPSSHYSDVLCAGTEPPNLPFDVFHLSLMPPRPTTSDNTSLYEKGTSQNTSPILLRLDQSDKHNTDPHDETQYLENTWSITDFATQDTEYSNSHEPASRTIQLHPVARSERSTNGKEEQKGLMSQLPSAIPPAATQSHSVETASNHQWSTSVSMDRTDSLFIETPTQRQHTLQDARSSRSGLDTHISFDPSIQVDEKKFWSLPWVRLTPVSKSSNFSYSRSLDPIPFVWDSDTTFRLPGPTRGSLFSFEDL